MRPTVSDLLLLAQQAYAGGDLHGAAEAWRRVLDQEPEHGAARNLLTQVEGQIEATLDDSFDVIADLGEGKWAGRAPSHPEADAPPDAATSVAASSLGVSLPAGAGDGVVGPQLPESESEVEFTDLLELEAYGTVQGSPPSAAEEASPDVSPIESLEVVAADPGVDRAKSAVPILVASPTPAVELSPGGAPGPPTEEASEVSTGNALAEETSEVPTGEAPAEGPEAPAFPDVVEVSPEDVVEAPSVVLAGSRPALDAVVEPRGATPPPEVMVSPGAASVEASPEPGVDEVEASPEAWPEVTEASPESPSGPLSDLGPDEGRHPLMDPDAVLRPLLQEVQADRGESALDMHAVLEPLDAAPEIAADPSEALVIEAMPTSSAEPEDYWGSMPEALPVVVATEPRMPSVSAPPTLSGVIHRTRTRAPASVMENTGDWSGVDLDGDRPERAGEVAPPDGAMTFAAPEDRGASGGLPAAVAAFQAGDPIGAYEFLVESASDDANEPSRREFLERLTPIVESELRNRIGPMDAVADLAVSPASLTTLDLDHRAGFILSQIDGFVSFDDVVDLSGMDQLATLRILVRLLDAGAIRR